MTTSGFFCPRTHEPLTISADNLFLESPAGDRYPIVDGIPGLLLDAGRQETISENHEYYRARAAEYDRGNDVMFRMLLSEEEPARTEMTAMLNIAPGDRVLEVGCGTCRDTVHLLARGAQVYASDLSREMIVIGRDRLRAAGADTSRVRLFLTDAMRLPFPDGFFDAAFHFGGLNLFSDIAAALAEMARVVKPGGRVVAGDEGVGAWLADTEFAKILENSNPLFKHRAPLDRIPVNARNVTCRWILNGSFYLIAFDVGAGEPQLDLDVQFPGWRGGSHRTRYFGKLEGVSPELRDGVVKAAAAEGVAVVTWLETALRRALEPKI
ncbi:MAG TPA: methyltransferase domain-containing protein [Bradyrhizobium sp.]|jgi:ubiquinone/menaquinone biosynthesis C-methylase UbiE|nr:methyltransferase domain-containing protein [Bradyrhizobium sp.]